MGWKESSVMHEHCRFVLEAKSKGANISELCRRYVGEPDIEEFLRKNVFEPGAVYHWNEMIERAKGEPLTPKYFVDEFVH